MFLVIISNTPDKINIIPRVILKVKCSLKNKIPKKIAVRGSKAPRIAVVVEPISLIANAQPHKRALRNLQQCAEIKVIDVNNKPEKHDIKT